MFTFLGDAAAGIAGGVAGAAGGVANTIGDLGAGLSDTISRGFTTFFPADTGQPIKSNIAQPAGASGLTYRPVAADSPSVWESAQMAAQDWINTPFENQYAIPAKVQQSQQLNRSVSSTTGGIGGLLEGVYKTGEQILTGAEKIGGLYREFKNAFDYEPRSPINEGDPNKVVRYTNQRQPEGANVLTLMKTYGEGMLQQVKGLFNLGYEQEQKQPAFQVEHELQPGNKLTGIIIVLVIAYVIYVWVK